jgi:hypothetical protein
MKSAITALLYVVIAFAPAGMSAATFTVTSKKDSGAGSLRQAILDANANPGPDIVDFAVTGTITLTSGQMTITDALTIIGPSAGSITINGNYASRIFDIESTSVSISGLIITNGVADASATGGSLGGGIRNAGGSLTLSSVTLSNNVALGGSSGGDGGGIANVLAGIVRASNVTLTRNVATGSCSPGLGGGIYNDAASALSFTASHVTRNIAGGSPGVGGGVYNLGTFSYDSKTVITGNRASTSGNNIGP